MQQLRDLLCSLPLFICKRVWFTVVKFYLDTHYSAFNFLKNIGFAPQLRNNSCFTRTVQCKRNGFTLILTFSCLIASPHVHLICWIVILQIYLLFLITSAYVITIINFTHMQSKIC